MNGLDLFETERLVLSGWRRDQLDDLVRLHGEGDNARYLSADGAPWSREKCAAALESWIALFEREQLGKLRLTRKSDGVMVGRAGFGIHAPTGEAELGYTLFRDHRGQGYATEAAAGLRDWIFEATMRDHFIGFADVRNEASLRILKGIGMRETGMEEYEGMTCRFHVLEKAR